MTIATPIAIPRVPALVDRPVSTPPDPAETAREAGLRYVTDSEPGIRRMKRGRGVRYLDPDGRVITDKRTLARIAALAIPPAWSHVWICARANGHLQATGRDTRGRKQYRYHTRWREVRDETKFGRMEEFGLALPVIRARVEEDVRRRGLPREKVLATVIGLLERTLIRVGNEEYARANDSYGLTTLRDDHVEVESSAVHFLFRGKSGKQHEIDLHDRRLARIVRQCRDLPGQTLFQYVDETGEPHSVGSTDVNAYLREITGQDFTAKDFRTWFGTVLAAEALLNADADDDITDARAVPAAIAAVAERLGNTPAVCRKCYVHPVVIDAFESGRLVELASRAAPGASSDRAFHERLVLELLNESRTA